MAQPVKTSTTTAFYVQAVLSFVISLVGLAAGILYLPVTTWVRSFLALGLMYVVTSTFTLAKCVRDRQEEASVVSGWTRPGSTSSSPSTTPSGPNDRRGRGTARRPVHIARTAWQ
ncbi:YiaA/YiaB family inner membrane protein [Microbispora sitophila]|uniref:YiaA/YiaB family inner membrane protein n=1 Tax=Microbispora sitophila TaxID=2771537 RepID=UPI001D01A012|nr:YiaA/YiaB family inner membrane protein [Microbispora sitophila]